jgi:ABC-type transport system involved in cytochrome bd biosynthesis fused ATPase/permease subunit
MFVREHKSFQKPIMQSYTLPSPAESAVYLLLTAVLFLLALWLLDHFVESNRGYKENVCKDHRKRKVSVNYQRSGDNHLVEITNLQKTYDERIFALQGVTAHLKRGEIVALLG